ncbi:hypothetical protein HanPSC8_Chr13g0590951 [Helianthus annuus]|nr:hypothetical protein HanHA89_Chr13g0535531 [Helianthus annuus]KAJ0851328.1 hypothetical protein HanPSC8_Chr13g0590951 [Helianthus annuus]
MMIGRLNRKARPVLREKNDDGLTEEAPLWRMFCPDFEGKADTVTCGAGHLGALGDLAATGVPKETVLKFGDKRQRKKKIARGSFCSVFGVGGGSAGAGGATTGTKPVDVKKQKGDAHVAGGEEVPELRKTWTTAVPKPNPAVSTGPMKEPVSLFATPPSSPKVVDVEVQKKGGEDPSIEVVSSGDTPPSVHAEQASKETTGGTIFDTLDSFNNLIDPQDDGGQGVGKPKSPIFEKTSGCIAAGTGVEDQPSIQPGESELEFYYHSYAAERGFDYHRPPRNVL